MEDMIAMAGPDAFRAWVTKSANHHVAFLGETVRDDAATRMRWLTRVRDEYVRARLQEQPTSAPRTMEEAREHVQLASLEEAYRACGSGGVRDSHTSFIGLASHSRPWALASPSPGGGGAVDEKRFHKHVAKLLKYCAKVAGKLGGLQRVHTGALHLLMGKMVQRLEHTLQALGPAAERDLGSGVRKDHLERMGLELWRCVRCEDNADGVVSAPCNGVVDGTACAQRRTPHSNRHCPSLPATATAAATVSALYMRTG